jgi:oxygen-independent coproporphyrinogen-3 oxidase
LILFAFPGDSAKLKDMPAGVYIHVPFCTKRCPYCDFAFVVRQAPPTARFTEAVRREIAAAGLTPADSVYFGGGTPSLLAPGELARILAAVPRRPGAPVTLEANPEQRDRFADLKAVGVTRLSIGVQSLTPDRLARLGRSHDAPAAREAVAEAMRVFGDVNADLIYGVPGQTEAELLADARDLVALGVTHLSAYGLTVHEGTLLAKDALHGRFTATGDEAERAQFLALDAFLRGAGFEHYEISNYARPGFRSFHNELYWTLAPYRGFGPSAHSFDPALGRRWWNVRSFDKWLARVEAGESPVEGEERLDAAAKLTERLYLSLRRSDGLELAAIAATPAFLAKVDAAVQGGLALRSGGRLCLTAAGMAVADTVVEELLGAL